VRRLVMAAVVTLVAPAASAASTGADGVEFRSLDGGGNLDHPQRGKLGRPYLRVAAPNYAEGLQSMVAGPPAQRLEWLPPAVPDAAGTRYWIALLAPAGTLVVRDRCCPAADDRTEQSARTALAGLPASWTPGTASNDAPVSAYATG
jgi:hypothetical protein